MWIKKVGYISFALLVASIAIAYAKRLVQLNELNKKLIIALNEENHDQMMRLINKGADPNTANKHDLTALMIAAKNGDLNLLDWLLFRGLKIRKNLNIDKETPWDQPHAGKPALSFALEAKNLDAVKLLVEAGANVNVYNDLGTTDIYTTIPEGLRQRNNPLLIYAIGRKLPIPFIETLLSSKKVEVNKQSLLYPVTALMIASAIGYEDAVKALLKAGADKEIVNTLDNKKAVDYARDAGYENIVKLLT